MTDVKIDHDEGSTLVTFESHDQTTTHWLNDDEAFKLFDLLRPYVERRRDEYEDHKQLYKGMEQAGMGYSVRVEP